MNRKKYKMFTRPCDRCGKLFRKTGKSCKICEECRQKSIKSAIIKRQDKRYAKIIDTIN